MQFYYIAVGDGMIWSYLLSIERPASPQPSELQRPCYILMHKPSHICHCVAATNDEWPCPVGWLAGRLCVHTYDSQCVEHKGRESLEPVAALCRHGKRRESHPGELLQYAHFVGAWIQITLVRDQEGG